ncbi:MAG: hypothetical protein OXD36_05740 [Rhodobacter sp.]|nr:hypothetical protein [Rhodobacter sp.]
MIDPDASFKKAGERKAGVAKIKVPCLLRLQAEAWCRITGYPDSPKRL